MWHPDEGTIHAWIEGQLGAEEEARVREHVDQCAECKGVVAEARGVIAGASRIVGFLDQGIGAGTAGLHGTATRDGDAELRHGTATRNGDAKRRFIGDRRGWMALAATLVIGVGSMFVLRGRPAEEAKKLIDTPVPRGMTMSAPAPETARTTLHVPQRYKVETLPVPPRVIARPVDGSTNALAGAGANTAEPKAAVAGEEHRDRPVPTPAPQPAVSPPFARAASPAPTSMTPTAATAASPGRMNDAAQRSSPAAGGAGLGVRQLAASATSMTLEGCYELLPSVVLPESKFAVLPRQFELSTVAADSVNRARRVVSRIVDGRPVEIPDLSWLPTGTVFSISGGKAGNLVANVATGVATAYDSTGRQQLQLTRGICP